MYSQVSEDCMHNLRWSGRWDKCSCNIVPEFNLFNLNLFYNKSREAIGAFKTPDWVTCRACDDSYHMKCLDPPLEHKPNKWRCPFCKETKTKVKLDNEERENKKEQKPLFEGEHDDDCFMCFNGGGKQLPLFFTLYMLLLERIFSSIYPQTWFAATIVQRHTI